MRSEGNDTDAATEKLNTSGQGDNGDNPRPRRRAGGGLSAQDLLRREGRL
jgi:RND superfamily putative drug exporter